MKSVLFAGSEALPFAATGGLGDVMGSLPVAIKAAHPEADVRAVMPLYSKVGKQYRDEMTFEKSITVTLAWRRLYCGIFSLERGGVNGILSIMNIISSATEFTASSTMPKGLRFSPLRYLN